MKIALCIPAYNAEQYLPRLLVSACKQIVPFNEILVYDDCCTDKTAEIAKKYNARVITGTVNKGCAYGKNQLAEIARSEWLHFHDADDDLLPDFTQLVTSWIIGEGNSYEVLLLNFNYVDFATKQLLGSANHDIKALHKDPVKYTIEHRIVNFGVYKRTSFLNAGGFNTDLKVLYNEDNAFHQNLALSGYRFDYLPKVTCINYRYAVSMSASNQLKCAQANFYVLKTVSEKAGNRYSAEIAKQVWHCMAILGSFEDWAYVKKSVRLLKTLNSKRPSNENKIFQLLATISPFYAIWIREKLIRLTKSNLRTHV